MEEGSPVFRNVRATAAKVCQVSPGEQALPRRHHIVRFVRNPYGRFHDVSCAYDLLPPEPVSVQRHDLGSDVRAARTGGRRTDCAGDDARLLWASTGKTRDHEIDDFRLDGPRLLSGGARSRAMEGRSCFFTDIRPRRGSRTDRCWLRSATVVKW